jgi:hypothetical protein
MSFRFALLGLVLAGATAAASVAQAASFTFLGGDDYALPGNFDPSPAMPGLGAGSHVLTNATLGLSGPGRVTFTFLGTEAGYDNLFHFAGESLFANHSGTNPSVERIAGAGPLDFAFSTVSPAQLVANGASAGTWGSIAFFKLSDTSVYALYNDGAPVDADYDDMAVRMDVAPVPLPAAAWLLVAGLGGLGLVKRRAGAATAA